MLDLILRSWSRVLFTAPFAVSAALGTGLAAAQPLPASMPMASSAGVVTVTNGLVTIESDLQRADNNTGVVTATGNVRIVYPDQRVVATARQAQYFSREGRVVLSGDVDVLQESGHSIRAERLVYWVERERLMAEPASGAQVVTYYQLKSPGLTVNAPGQKQ